MAGRKPTPRHLKVIRGNPGKRPLNKNEPDFSSDLPVAPGWLSERAKEIFTLLVSRLTEMGCASASHTEALALAAMRQEEVEICSAELQKALACETKIIAGGTAIKASPYVAIRSKASRHLQSLLAEFGLTPSSATKIVASSKQKKNPFKML